MTHPSPGAQFEQDTVKAMAVEAATHKDIFAKENTALKKATAATAVDTAAIKDAVGRSHHHVYLNSGHVKDQLHVGLRTKGGKTLETALGEQVQLDLAENAMAVTRNENKCHKASTTHEERTEVLEESKKNTEVPDEAPRHAEHLKLDDRYVIVETNGC